MDSLRRAGILCILSVLALPIAAGLSAGAKNPPEDTADPAPFISEDALRGLDEVGKVLSAPDSSGNPVSAGLDAIERAWVGAFRARLIDSTMADPTPVAKLAGAQVNLIDDLISAAKTNPDRRSASGKALEPLEVVVAINNLTALKPILQAVSASRQSALLVVSSVSCECEHKRCEKMLGVYGPIATANPGAPMSVVDMINMPAAGDPLGVTTIPSWVLFRPDGSIASTISGFEESDDARKAVSSWLGLEEKRGH